MCTNRKGTVVATAYRGVASEEPPASSVHSPELCIDPSMWNCAWAGQLHRMTPTMNRVRDQNFISFSR